MTSSPSGHAERYRGSNLLRLLAALCVPAGVLYLRIVATFAAEESHSTWLFYLGTGLLFLFFVVQLLAARYLQTLLPPRQNPWRQALEFAGVFLMGLLFSVTGAVMLEAFGYSLFIHLRSGSGG